MDFRSHDFYVSFPWKLNSYSFKASHPLLNLTVFELNHWICVCLKKKFATLWTNLQSALKESVTNIKSVIDWIFSYRSRQNVEVPKSENWRELHVYSLRKGIWLSFTAGLVRVICMRTACLTVSALRYLFCLPRCWSNSVFVTITATYGRLAGARILGSVKIGQSTSLPLYIFPGWRWGGEHKQMNTCTQQYSVSIVSRKTMWGI